MTTKLLPLVTDLTSRADSLTRSQKYSGAILSGHDEWIYNLRHRNIIFAKIIILFKLCKSNNYTLFADTHLIPEKITP